MNVVFFLVRLVFFMIGILLLLVPVGLALQLAPIILLLALGIWLVMLVLVLIGAAFENSSEGIAAFIGGTGEAIKEYSTACIKRYFKAYKDLWNWLLRGSQSQI